MPLKAIASGSGEAFIDGDWIESRHLAESGVRYITTGNVGVGIYKEQGTGYISDETFSELGCTAVQTGDVLISRLNVPIGRACLAPDLGVRVVTSVDNVIVRASPLVDRRWLVFRLSSPDYLHEAGTIASGATMQRISRSELGSMRLAFPPLNEQRAITTFLDHETAKIDGLIAEQEKLIALLAEKRQATISHAVTRGLNPQAPMKDSGVPWLGEVPAHWGVSALSYIASIETGSTPDRSEPAYWNGDIPWLKTGEINWEPIREAEEFITEAGLANSAAKIAPPHTLLMAMYGQGVTRGRVALLEIAATYNQACAAIRFAPRVAPEFGRYFFMAAYSHVRDEGNETSQMNLSAGLIAKIRLPVPPLEEQAAVVRLLDAVTVKLDGLQAEAQRGIALLKERRSALIAAAVTGQIDVRGAVAQATSAQEAAT